MKCPKHNKMDRTEAYSTGRADDDWSDEYANEDLASGEFQVLPYRAKSYLCPGGARLIYNDMVRRGLPTDFTGWLFITLTLDREPFNDDPEAGYLAGKARLKQFFKYLKRHGYKVDRYIWKLEFHEESPDWTHWHILLDNRRFIDWQIIKRAWNLGGVDVERIGYDDHGKAIAHYEFKYPFKEFDEIPEWILKYKRIRFVQTAGIFPPDDEETKEEDVKRKLDRLEDNFAEGVENRDETPTIGQRLQQWKRKITVVTEVKEGTRVRAYDLTCSTETLFGRLWAANYRHRILRTPFNVLVKKHQLITQHVKIRPEVRRILECAN